MNSFYSQQAGCTVRWQDLAWFLAIPCCVYPRVGLCIVANIPACLIPVLGAEPFSSTLARQRLQ